MCYDEFLEVHSTMKLLEKLPDEEAIHDDIERALAFVANRFPVCLRGSYTLGDPSAKTHTANTENEFRDLFSRESKLSPTAEVGITWPNGE